MKMKCLDSRVCVYYNPYCWYDNGSNSIGCECVQTPGIYLTNHPSERKIPTPEPYKGE